jgi:hypothetical protein
MADNTTQPGVRLNESVWQQFRDDVRERKGVVQGHLKHELEQALKEYINASHGGDTHDRLTEIEAQLQELTDAISEQPEKKKDSGISSVTEERLSDVRDEIDEKRSGQPKVHEDVVEMAIRNNAGSSTPTIRRYKRLLKQDRVLYPHPTEGSLYFCEAEDFTRAVNSMVKGGKIKQKTYDELVDHYGSTWWEEQLSEEQTDGGVAFQ